MTAFLTLESARPTSIDMPFEEFLGSSYMRNHARTGMCSPEHLLADHLPAFDPDDEDETHDAFSEACELATDGAAMGIRLDNTDLRFVRRHFCREHFAFVPSPGPLDAA